MAMIKCPECGTEISSKADACPKCGFSLKEKRKKKQQKVTTCGCLVILAFFMAICLSVCSQMGGDGSASNAQVQSQKPTELTEMDKYKKRIDRCVTGKNLRAHPTNILKKELVSPRSYVAEETFCYFPKQGEPLSDTLFCDHTFLSKNRLNAEIRSTAKMMFILPKYSEYMYNESCDAVVISIE